MDTTQTLDQFVAGLAFNHGNLIAQYGGGCAVVTFHAAPGRQFIVTPNGLDFEVTELEAVVV